MDRRGRLTYERLRNSLSRLHAAIETQFPHLKDRARAQELQRVIEDALTSARAGMSGAERLSPIQMKREVEARIVDVHERYSEIDEREECGKAAVVGVESGDTNASAFDFAVQDVAQRSPSRCSPDGGKENATPPASAPQGLLAKRSSVTKPSAVRKTAITKRPAVANRKPPPTPVVRNNKPSSTRSTKPPPPPNAEEADRRAAAAALLGLSEKSHFHSAATPTSATSTLPRGTKRAYSVYQDEEDTPPVNDLPTALSAPMLKQRKMTPVYAPLPRVDGVVARRAFLAGVEYAVKCFAAREPGAEVARLLSFVGRELGAGGAGDGDGESGGAEQGKVGEVGVGGSGRAGGKGFWDVI